MEEIAEEDYNEDTDESVDDGESHTPAYIYNMKNSQTLTQTFVAIQCQFILVQKSKLTLFSDEDGEFKGMLKGNNLNKFVPFKRA